MFYWKQGYTLDSIHNRLLLAYLKDKSKVIKCGLSSLEFSLITTYVSFWFVIVFALKFLSGLNVPHSTTSANSIPLSLLLLSLVGLVYGKFMMYFTRNYNGKPNQTQGRLSIFNGWYTITKNGQITRDE